MCPRFQIVCGDSIDAYNDFACIANVFRAINNPTKDTLNATQKFVSEIHSKSKSSFLTIKSKNNTRKNKNKCVAKKFLRHMRKLN